VGRPAVRSAAPSVAELRRFADDLPELARNIAIIVESLDDRENAVEAHPLSPGRRGWTALENVMNYVFNQVMAINIYDRQSHILKGAVFVNDCSPYADVEHAKGKERCRTILGPSQPGVNAPDESRAAVGDQPGARRRSARSGPGRPAPLDVAGPLGKIPEPIAPSAPQREERAPERPTGPLPPLPGLPPLPAPPAPPETPRTDQAQDVLDYLLGP
jgi:hypothetical protein